MKLKPHKGVYKIRIYKTNGKRVPRSRHELRTRNGELYRVDNWPLVTDLTRADPKDTFIDLLSNLPDESIFEPIPKPSLWQRIKRKVKR